MIDDEIQDYLFQKIVKYCWLGLAGNDRARARVLLQLI